MFFGFPQGRFTGFRASFSANLAGVFSGSLQICPKKLNLRSSIFSDQGVCFASWYSFSFEGHFSLFLLYFKFSILRRICL